MADWDFIDEVDVLAKLPSNFNELIESKKWQERKEGLEALLKLIEANPRLSTKANYGEIANTLQTMLAKDANINVQALVAKCVAGIAAGLRSKFTPYAQSIVPVIIDKFKEKKPLLVVPLIECIDNVIATVPIENLCEEIVAGLGKPNPNIKQQTASFIARYMHTLSTDKAPRKLIKAVVPLLAKLAGDADVGVRDNAMGAIGAIQRLIGDKNTLSMIGDLEKDAAKMAKIKEFAEKAAEEAAKIAEATAPASSAGLSGAAAEQEEGDVEQTGDAPVAKQSPKESDPWDFLEEFDVLAKMDEKFGENMESKKWTDRRDALQGVIDLCTANPRLASKAQYGDLVGTLKKVIEKDANINVCALAAKLMCQLASGLRTKFSPHSKNVLPSCLEKFKEKKPTLQVPLAECVDNILATTSLDELVEELTPAMGKPNPQIKQQTNLVISRALNKVNSNTAPKKAIKAVAPFLIKHTGDSDADVRESAYTAIGSIMRTIGEKPCTTIFAELIDDKTKMGKIKEHWEKAIAEHGNGVQAAPVAGPPTTAAAKKPAGPPKKAAPGGEKKPPSGAGGAGSRPPSRGPPGSRPRTPENDEQEKPVTETKKAAVKAAATPVKKALTKEEEPKNEELISPNEEKEQRRKDERQLRALKWNFASPDEEHVSQLMEQLGKHAKAALVGMMFHKDFKKHIQACEEIVKVCETNPAALVKNSDLLLKWCTIRFFDTNPAVMIKVLELARLILKQCQDANEDMSAEEVSAFTPYLLIKLGEQKENMRNVAKEIIDLLTNLVGPRVLVPFVMDALKTKTARQRMELLTVMEKFVSTVGAAQFKNANNASVLKEVAACVGDRDQTVRSAAINCLVAAYKDEGETMWKMAGKMPDKDKAMVEERIKRTGAQPGSAKAGGGAPATSGRGGPTITKPVAVVPGSAVRGGRSQSRTRREEDDPEGDGPMNTTHTRTAPGGRGRQSNALNGTFDAGSRRRMIQLDDSDDEGEEETARDRINRTLQGLESQPLPPPPRDSRSDVGVFRRTNSSSSISSIDSSDQLVKAIQNISSGMIDVATEGTSQIEYLLTVEEQRHMVYDKIDLILQAMATQLNLVMGIHISDLASTGKTNELMKNMFKLFESVEPNERGLGRATVAGVKPLMDVFVKILSNDLDKLKLLGEFAEIIKRSLNRAVLRLCSYGDPTATTTALLQSLALSLMRVPGSSTNTLYVKALQKVGKTLSGADVRVQPLAFIAAANDFYRQWYEQRNRDDQTKEAVLAVDFCVERVVFHVRDAARHAVTQLPSAHQHTIDHVETVTNGLADAVGGGNAGLRSLVAESIRVGPTKSGQMDKVCEWIRKNPQRRAEVDDMFAQFGFGEGNAIYSSRIDRALRGEATTLDMGVEDDVMRAMNSLIASMGMKLAGMGVDMGKEKPVVERATAGGGPRAMDVSMEGDLQVPASLPTAPPPRVQRRSVDPAALASAKKRLEALNQRN